MCSSDLETIRTVCLPVGSYRVMPTVAGDGGHRGTPSLGTKPNQSRRNGRICFTINRPSPSTFHSVSHMSVPEAGVP